MKRFIGAALAAAIAVLCHVPAKAIDLNVVVLATCGTVPLSLPTGTGYSIFTDQNGNLCMNGSVTLPANQSVNVSQINGVTPLMGNGLTGTGSQRVTIASDNTAFSVNAVESGIWTVQPGNTPNTSPWLFTEIPSAASGAGLAAVSSSSLVANTVIKASAGNLYSFEVSADSTLSAAAWWIMIYNATSAPVDGAVTPLKCYAMALGSTSFAAAFRVPIAFSTGITIGVSTTGCFTKTASTHAFISGDAQ